MGFVAQSSNYQNFIKNSDLIPEYARDFKNEYLFIIGINKTCGKFLKRLEKVDFSDGFNEEVFMSPQAESLMSYFRKFLKAQKLGYLKDIRDFCFKESDVEFINDLNVELYDIVVKLNESSIFQDFFESFIVFRFNLNYDNLIESEYDSVSDSYIDIYDLIISNNDSDSDSD